MIPCRRITRKLLVKLCCVEHGIEMISRTAILDFLTQVLDGGNLPGSLAHRAGADGQLLLAGGRAQRVVLQHRQRSRSGFGR